MFLISEIIIWASSLMIVLALWLIVKATPFVTYAPIWCASRNVPDHGGLLRFRTQYPVELISGTSWGLKLQMSSEIM